MLSIKENFSKKRFQEINQLFNQLLLTDRIRHLITVEQAQQKQISVFLPRSAKVKPRYKMCKNNMKNKDKENQHLILL